MKRRVLTLLILSMLSLSKANASTTCADSGLLSGKLITDICWSCLYPIKAAGFTMIGGGRVPDGAATQVLCACEDDLGVPSPGIMSAMWEPARVVELVREPGCMASMNTTLNIGDKRDWGDAGQGGDDGNETGSGVFYHYNYYSFPLLLMMELFVESYCTKDGWADFDVMFMSIYDPIWRNEELALMAYSEAPLVANVAAISACPADAISSTAGNPLSSLWWCAGSWGEIYNISGHTGEIGSMPNNTSLLATRAVAATHRRGLAFKTMGEENMCDGSISPMLPKDQYKWTMFWPVPERTSDHVTGENTFRWGEWRNPPTPGSDDAIYLLWRWNDCCNTY